MARALQPVSARFMCTATEGVMPKYQWDVKEEPVLDTQISKFTHRSNAQELISQVPVVEVDGTVARCSGVNEFGYGHPVHYIQLDTKNRGKPVACKWCGLRFKQRGY